MSQLSKEPPEKVGNPVSPKKPLPSKEGCKRIPIPIGEQRIREIAKEEIAIWHRAHSVQRQTFPSEKRGGYEI